MTHTCITHRHARAHTLPSQSTFAHEMETVSAMGNKALLADSTQWERYLYLYSKKKL